MSEEKVVFKLEDLSKTELINLIAQKNEKISQLDIQLNYVQNLYDKELRTNAVAEFVKKEAKK